MSQHPMGGVEARSMPAHALAPLGGKRAALYTSPPPGPCRALSHHERPPTPPTHPHLPIPCSIAEDDIDVSQMQAKLDPVPIEQLAAFADKKMTVDLLAVVSSVGPLGSVKRKVDAAELARRDVTLVDQGCVRIG